ncbi:hypothetical protein BCR43DRAFT_461407 [Syncephalastrum racemosum]|uniref:Zn(2)-C6 fungal-type domain-containing protein n=1 Tax=Syncephalastrum racemosum TaxID=13706 RepID=A0A1X2H7J1_SYNRA|nr:hypothetical protein BCR43DRAFT_461407 [Syncephalastrum racemosum]
MQEVQFNNYLQYEPSDADSNKRKKATRACFHCQKAHLTCDDSRPCQRCIKRGLAPTCTDAIRKRAKYLQQDEGGKDASSDNLFGTSSFSSPLDQVQSSIAGTGNNNNSNNNTSSNNNTNLMDTSANPFLNLSLNELQEFGFGSETTGLEYGFLGNMLQNPLDLNTSSGAGTSVSSAPSATSMTDFSASLDTMGFPAFTNTNTSNTISSVPMTVNNPYNAFPGLFPMSTTVSFAPGANTLANSSNSPGSSSSPQQSTMKATPTSTPNSSSTPAPSKEAFAMPKQSPTVRTSSAIPPAVSPSSNSATSPSTVKRNSTSSLGTPKRKIQGNTPEAVYTSVRRPFNYAEGFHYLIQYVREKMGREDLMRISRALALFRPSFLALIMNLTEEDLVFMEKCMQRTLLEYEKLISFSGTPTVVWRRTGEVCLVGKEFLLLTQWPKDTLLNKKTYIYELMDNQSAVEYWEKFSTHAFDNTDKSCIYSCILKTPNQKPVPCTFCFTIKRDIFDLPSVIVGNFLPILS